MLKKYYHLFFLILILAGGLGLRLINFRDWSFNQFELHLLTSLDQKSLKQVLLSDIPIVTELLLYFWTKTGLNEFIVRLPFVAAGSGAVIFIYLTAKAWFGERPGLFVAAASALLSFPVIFSQMALPFILGHFFFWAAVWCWTKILNSSIDPVKKIQWLFVAFFLLTVYSTALAVVPLMLLAVWGIWLVQKEYRKQYLLTVVISIVLSSPVIYYIFDALNQAKEGAGFIEADFFIQHIHFLFDQSAWVYLAVVAVLSYAIFSDRWPVRINKLQVLSLTMFLIPFFAGSFLQIKGHPAIQHAYFMITTPFLFLLIFSFLRSGKTLVLTPLLVVFMATASFNTITMENKFANENFARFKEIVTKAGEWKAKYGDFTTVVDVAHPEFVSFYERRDDKNKKLPKHKIDYGEDYGMLLKTVERSNADYFFYAWSARPETRQNTSIIREFFPKLVEKYEINNTGIYLFKKEQSDKKPVLLSTNNYEQSYPLWSEKEDFIVKKPVFNGSRAEKVGPDNEYSATFSQSAWKITTNYNNIYVHAKAMIYLTDKALGNLVIEVRRGEEQFEWYGTEFSHFGVEPGKWQKVMASRDIPVKIYPDDIVLVYLWNRGEGDFYVDDVVVEIFEKD